MQRKIATGEREKNQKNANKFSPERLRQRSSAKEVPPKKFRQRSSAKEVPPKKLRQEEDESDCYFVHGYSRHIQTKKCYTSL
jgi:hypothetical protein